MVKDVMFCGFPHFTVFLKSPLKLYYQDVYNPSNNLYQYIGV